tara:strand:+ start:2378 stop:2644 length:267 start_codon:yes stop_codon:yes gene_type:complete
MAKCGNKDEIAKKAVLRYAHGNVPCTTLEIFQGATLKSGKLMRLSNHSVNKFKISHILKADKHFAVDNSLTLHRERMRNNAQVWVKIT